MPLYEKCSKAAFLSLSDRSYAFVVIILEAPSAF